MMVESLAPLVPGRQLQTLFAPKPLDLLVVYMPALGCQQLGNLAIAVPPVLFGQPDQGQA